MESDGTILFFRITIFDTNFCFRNCSNFNGHKSVDPLLIVQILLFKIIHVIDKKQSVYIYYWLIKSRVYIINKSSRPLIGDHLIDALLLVDHVAGLVHQCHQFIDACSPVIEEVRWRLLNSKVHNSCWPIDLHRQHSSIHQTRQVLLRLWRGQLQQFTHPRQSDPCVIVGDDADVLQ